jgi:DNA-binding response OmpR family regulator
MMLASGKPSLDLLLVASHPTMARSLRTGLEEEGFAVHSVDNPDKAQDLLRSRAFTVIIVDIPADKDHAVLQNWRQAHITTPVLILSTPGSSLEKLNAHGLGPGAFLAKPFGFDDLLDRLALLTEPKTSLARKESSR